MGYLQTAIDSTHVRLPAQNIVIPFRQELNALRQTSSFDLLKTDRL